MPGQMKQHLNPTFSVVIPTRNRPALLASAITSVVDQTFDDLEVVLIDDGSDPPVRSEAFSDVRILKVYRNERAQGAAAARNLGAAMATGDFIAFLDDDDLWVPKKLDVVRLCLEANPSIDVVTHLSSWEIKPTISTPTCLGIIDPIRWALTRQPPHLSGVVVRRSLHLGVEFDEAFDAAEDLDYLVRLFQTAQTTASIPAVLAIHNRPDHEESVISLERRIEGRLMVRRKHEQLFKNPEVEAFFLARLAHQYRRAGHPVRAISVAMKSLWTRPTALGTKAFVAGALPRRFVASTSRRRRRRR